MGARFGAKLFDLRSCGVRFEERVVDQTGNIHGGSAGTVAKPIRKSSGSPSPEIASPNGSDSGILRPHG